MYHPRSAMCLVDVVIFFFFVIRSLRIYKSSRVILIFGFYIFIYLLWFIFKKMRINIHMHTSTINRESFLVWESIIYFIVAFWPHEAVIVTVISVAIQFDFRVAYASVCVYIYNQKNENNLSNYLFNDMSAYGLSCMRICGSANGAENPD